MNNNIISFREQDAIDHGANKAILIQNLRHWITFNQRRGVNNKNGYTWAYMTAEQISAQYPYFAARSVNRWLSELEKSGVIIKAKLSDNKYNQTVWYTMPEFAKKERKSLKNIICQNGESNGQNGESNGQNGESLRSIKKDLKEDLTTTTTIQALPAQFDREARPVDSLRIDEIPDDFEMALHLSGYSGNERIWEIWSAYHSYINAEQHDSKIILNRHRLLQKFKNFLSTDRIYQQKIGNSHAKKHKSTAKQHKSEQVLTVADRRRQQMRREGYDV